MPELSKKQLTEQEIRSRFITPALQRAGWDLNQIREEYYFTDGKIEYKGKTHQRGERKFADYVLYYHDNFPLAVIEAKDNNHTIGSGLGQAMDYAAILDAPFAYSSNGDGFLEHDRTGTSPQPESELALDQFPSPEALWQRYLTTQQLTPQQQEILLQPYYPGEDQPRYYQQVAINRAVQAILKGQNRILLVMATGTGKTFTAFQIIWRLWRARLKKRILFLADRNLLINQTKMGDFAPFGDAMAQITGHEVEKSHEIYLSLYQAITGPEEEMKAFKQFSPDFFDLIVIDECHRGSAAADSAWREILEYFNTASHIGLTATPKETKYVSSTHYFGEPVYTYSLRQGIADGFLAPYKVIRYNLDVDVDGFQTEPGQLDLYGEEIPDDRYYGPDYDRLLIIQERTRLVAALVTDYMRKVDPYQKAIVFCVNINHAERMRHELVNLNPDLVAENEKYVMRITGDAYEGKLELDNFQDVYETYPVIVTTSKLLTTGVNVKTCKLIVLDSNINSLTEFKQIIGRGTRIDEEHGKTHFAIIDFRNATRLFEDPDFDGEINVIYEGGPGNQPDFTPEPEDEDDEHVLKEHRHIYTVNNVPVTILAKRVQYIDAHGNLITESISDYTRRNCYQLFPTLDDFINTWEKADRKEAVMRELTQHGVLWNELADEIGEKAYEMDPFDLICHIAYDQKPLTRSERARKLKQNPRYLEIHQELAQKVLNALLDQYAALGYDAFTGMLDTGTFADALSVPPFTAIGTPVEIIKSFGGRPAFEQALHQLQDQLYQPITQENS